MRNRMRRFRRMPMGPRLTSARERSDADLFWASLVGGPAAPAQPHRGALPAAAPAVLSTPPSPTETDEGVGYEAPEDEDVDEAQEYAAPTYEDVDETQEYAAPTYEDVDEAQEYAAPAYEDVDEAADSLVEALPAGLTASPCDVSKTSETLLFGHNQSTVTPAHAPIITRLKDCLMALRAGPRPIRDVHIVGFASPPGTETHNQTLGLNRANAVRDALRNAIPAADRASFNFRPASRGETQQIPGGDAANRRVEVFVDIAVSDIVVHATDPETREIPSNLGAAGLEHFCCVKNTGNIVLEALISPNIPGNITGRLRWGPAGTMTSPAVGTDGRTARAPSTAEGKFPIQISWDGAVVRNAVIWVIWSDIIVTCTRQPTTPAVAGFAGLVITAGIDHTFRVQPREIISDADRPALDGAPTAPVPGAALTHAFSGDPLGGGAAKKWDASRQIRLKALNPHLYSVEVPGPPLVPGLPRVRPPAHLWNGQPAAVTTPENYPANDALGNDDSNHCDETNNPYENCRLVTALDNPRLGLRHALGANGDTFELRYHFREFLRVNLGNAWFRASDFSLWRFHARFRRAGGVWTNNGSTFAQDNAGF